MAGVIPVLECFLGGLIRGAKIAESGESGWIDASGACIRLGMNVDDFGVDIKLDNKL